MLKTQIELNAENNALLQVYDNRFNLETAIKNLFSNVIDSKEQFLGNPSTNNFVLSSTIAGVRSWVAPSTTPTLTNTRIAFGSASNVITESADLTWNSTNKRIGIGSIINSQYGIDSVNPDGSSVIHTEAQGSGSRFAGYVAVVPSTSTSCAYFQLKVGFNLLQAQMYGSGNAGLSLGVPIADNALFFSSNDRNLIISASGAAATGNIIFGVGNTAASGQVATISNEGLTIINNYPIRFNNPTNTFYTEIKAGANAANYTITLPAAAPATDTYLKFNGINYVWAVASGSSSGITSLNTLTGSTQTFANDTNITMVSTGTTHVLTWAGTLADVRIASASTWNAKLSNITGLVTQGTNITVTGSGTSASPYVINSTAVASGAEPYTSIAYASSLTFDVLSAREKNFDVTTFNGNLTIGYSNMGNGAVSSVRLNKTSASALTVTLPTVTNIICNHPDCVVSGDVITITSATGTKYIISTTKVGSDLIAIVNRVDQDENYGGGGSTITLTTIGTIPNINAATITGSVLNLEPASELFGGVITTTTQKFAGNKTLSTNGTNAISAVTQKSSFKLGFESSLWNGSVESKKSFEIYSRVSNSINNESFLTLSYDSFDFLKFKNDGLIWDIPFLQNFNNFNIVAEGTKKLISINNSKSSIGFGYDIFNTTYTGVFNFVFGNGGGNFLTNGSRNTFLGSVYAWQITSGNDNLIIGSYTTGNNTVTGSGNIILNTGQVSLTSGNYNINLGNTCVTSTVTVSNEFNIGGTSGGFTTANITNQSISVINIGNGGKNDLYNGTDVLFRVTPTSVLNTANGGHLSIGAGSSTGAGIGGSIFLQTSPSGAAGNTPNALITVQTIDEKGNIGFNGTSFGVGVKVMFIANATTVPTTNPVGGGILYVEGGALKFRGSSGTITIIANA